MPLVLLAVAAVLLYLFTHRSSGSAAGASGSGLVSNYNPQTVVLPPGATVTGGVKIGPGMWLVDGVQYVTPVDWIPDSSTLDGIEEPLAPIRPYAEG